MFGLVRRLRQVKFHRCDYKTFSWIKGEWVECTKCGRLPGEL